MHGLSHRKLVCALAFAPLYNLAIDAVRAAEPTRVAPTVRANAAAGVADDVPAFETIVRHAAEEPVSRPAPSSQAGSSATAASKQANALRQFEAFVLQSFVQSMLPKASATLFGKGTAGEVWRSMLAEKIGQQIAQSGTVGIAERIAASRPGDAAAAVRRPAVESPEGSRVPTLSDNRS
jgi:hypothetical protein